MEALREISKSMKLCFVYIAEAHADNTWPLGLGVSTWETTGEGLEHLHKLMSQVGEKIPEIEWYLDGHNELFQNYSVWPERILFLDEDRKILQDLAPPYCHSAEVIMTELNKIASSKC